MSPDAAGRIITRRLCRRAQTRRAGTAADNSFGLDLRQTAVRLHYTSRAYENRHAALNVTVNQTDCQASTALPHISYAHIFHDIGDIVTMYVFHLFMPLPHHCHVTAYYTRVA